MNQGTRLDSDNLRIEIAILKEKIHAFIPEYGKFNIPAIMESKGVKNASNEDNDFIWLYVPYEYTFAWGNEWIPAGTRFVVADIGGNVNDSTVFIVFHVKMRWIMVGEVHGNYNTIKSVYLGHRAYCLVFVFTPQRYKNFYSNI